MESSEPFAQMSFMLISILMFVPNEPSKLFWILVSILNYMQNKSKQLG